MPTYDYVCQACEHAFEEFQSMTAKPLRKCPKCGKQKLKRLIGTGAGVIFKGSGFWQTDYRSSSYKAGEKAESDAGTKSSETAGATKDATAKPDASAKAETAKSDSPATKKVETPKPADAPKPAAKKGK